MLFLGGTITAVRLIPFHTMKLKIMYSREGFTLIELLTVIGIVGILAVGLIAFINPIEQLNKSRDARRKSDLSEIQKALELYYQDNGSYPGSSGGKLTGSSGDIEWGSNGFVPYMSVLPKDPGAGQYYYSSVGGQAYYIFASLDRGGKDQAACYPKEEKACLNAPLVGANCGSGRLCNFGVSSPNVSPNSN
jgi:general secretion pathway protein G